MAKKWKPYIVFPIVGGLIMLLAMMVGEWLYGPIFNGFIHKPRLWLMAFLETIFWMLPLTWISGLFIAKLPFRNTGKLILVMVGFWLLVSISIFALYIGVSDPRLPLWHKAWVTPVYVFGWYLPGVMTILIFSTMSPYFFKRNALYSE